MVKLRQAFFAILCLLSIFFLSLGFCQVQSVVDDADLFSDREISMLESKISDINSKGRIDVAVWTTRSLPSSTDRQLEAAADDFYDSNGYGTGSDKSGILLMIDMHNRYVHISTSGKMIDLFTDRDISSAISGITSYLGNGSYYEGTAYFLNLVSGKFIHEGTVGTNRVDRDTGNVTWSSTRVRFLTGGELVFAVAAAAAAGLAVLLGIYGSYQMKTISGQDYGVVSDITITEDRETYTHQHTTRMRIASSTSSGSSSSGGWHTSTTHRSSGGSHHGGGGGHF